VLVWVLVWVWMGVGVGVDVDLDGCGCGLGVDGDGCVGNVLHITPSAPTHTYHHPRPPTLFLPREEAQEQTIPLGRLGARQTS